MSAVAKKTDGTVELSKFDQFIAFAQERAELDASYNTSEELAREQVIKIVDAETVDDLFAAMKSQGLTGLRDLENGAELTIRGYRLVKSNNPELSGRTGVFAVIDAVDMVSGEDLALDTSIERAIAFLLKCEMIDAFPVHVRLDKKQTMGGNTLITFVKPPVRK